MEKFVPFSNGTEAGIWVSNNCDVCATNSGCFAKKNIEFGFVSGEITIKAAYFIGINKKMLLDVCQNKDKRVIKKRKSLVQNINESENKLF